MYFFSPAFQPNNYEDKRVLKSLNSIFVSKRGVIFDIPPPGNSVVLAVSGGMDSISLWYLLLEKYKLHVYPLYLDDGRIFNKNEIKSILFFAELFKNKYPRLYHPVKIIARQLIFNFSLKYSRRASKDLVWLINNLSYNKEKDRYSLGLISDPSRLGYFVLASYEYALWLKLVNNVNPFTILIGIVPEDGCVVRESTLTVLRSLNLTLCLILGDWRWQVSAPIEKAANFFYTKTDLVKYATRKQIPIYKTWSCRRGFPLHCGHCGNCRNRHWVYNTLKIKDATTYLVPEWILNLKDKLNIKNRLIKFVNRLLNIPNSSPVDKQGFKKIEEMRILLTNNISWQKIGDKIYILNKTTGTIESFDKTGSFLFQQIARNTRVSFGRLLTQLKKRYNNVDKNILKNDLSEFLKELVHNGYITFTKK